MEPPLSEVQSGKNTNIPEACVIQNMYKKTKHISIMFSGANKSQNICKFIWIYTENSKRDSKSTMKIVIIG